MESFTNLKNSLVTLSTEHLIKTCHKKKEKEEKGMENERISQLSSNCSGY